MNHSVFWGVCVTVGQSGGLYIVGGGRTAVKAVEHCGAAHSGAAAERIKHTVLSQRSCSSVKPLTEEGALAATTQRKRRWRRHAAHAAATVLPPPTAPTTHVVENFNRVYYFFQRHVSSTMVYTSTIKTQMNQEFYCCWADWAVRAVRTIAAIWGIPNFAKVSFF